MFIAIDFETANHNKSSICQAGLAIYRHGIEIHSECLLINPSTYFDPINVNIHKITQDMVASSPTFKDTFANMHKVFEGRIVVSHTLFDKDAIETAYAASHLEKFSCHWLDSCEIARRAWPHLSNFRLNRVMDHLGMRFQHHDALADARAAATVLLAGLQTMGMSLDDAVTRFSVKPFLASLIRRAETPPTVAQQRYGKILSKTKSSAAAGNQEGRLSGHICVFTGELSMARDKAVALALEAGCDVHPNITRKTTILVYGVQDMALTRGHEKSSKHRKAEELKGGGQDILILNEEEFHILIATCQ